MSFLPFDEQDDDLLVRDFSVARHDEVGRDAPVGTLERSEAFGLENGGMSPRAASASSRPVATDCGR
jgi:hypothetical protein